MRVSSVLQNGFLLHFDLRLVDLFRQIYKLKETPFACEFQVPRSLPSSVYLSENDYDKALIASNQIHQDICTALQKSDSNQPSKVPVQLYTLKEQRKLKL